MNKAKQQIDDALEQLGQSLDRGMSGQMKAMLKTMARFHRYSWCNVLLISVQRPDATQVAGYRTWQRLKRQVKQGERGISILAPMVRRGNGAAAEEVEEGRVMGFRTAHIFDVSQTSGEPLPQPATVRGDPGIYLARVKQLTDQLGIGLEYADSIGAADGVSRGGSIVIREGLSPADELSVLTHELAHELMHKGQNRPPKLVRETEAEAVAYVACEALGLDTNTASSDYIQLYQGTRETLAASLGRIRRTAAMILDGIMDREALVPVRDKAVESEQLPALAA